MATSCSRLTDICVISVSRDVRKFTSAFSALLGTAYLHEGVSVQFTALSEPFLTGNGRKAETQARFSKTAFLIAVCLLSSFCYLFGEFMSTADIIFSTTDVRSCEAERYARSPRTFKGLYAELLKSLKHPKRSKLSMTWSSR